MNNGQIEQIKRLIAARYPIIYIVTWEERRLEGFLKKIADSGFSTPLKFFIWSQTDGMVLDGKAINDTKDPLKALDFVLRHPEAGIFAFRDFHVFLDGSHHEVERKLRDLYHANKNSVKPICFISPLMRIPEILNKEVTVVDFSLPTLAEMEGNVDYVLQSYKNLQPTVSAEIKRRLATACLGLTLDEARGALNKIFVGKATLKPEDVHLIFDEKKNLVRKEGILEFIELESFSLSQVGGLDNLKEWLDLRKSFFAKEATDFGIDAPKGVLLTGVPGCGKSVCVKAIAAHWALPLFRLDMDRIYGGMASSPEEGLRRALKMVEAAAPAVLWIDEMEKGVAGYALGGGQGADARTFGLFLTWMQDKKNHVFVAATANEVDKLPPELLRKGRFDEIFFVDLPNDQERAEIFGIHLRLHKQEVGRFDLMMLAKGTNGFTGSEIEQVVLAGLYDAFAAKRELSNTDLHKTSARMVALSVTMAERIKNLKRWAQYRAVKATKAAVF